METFKLEQIDRIQNYILGGKADFIVNDITNDEHINFKVKKSAKNPNLYYVTYKSLDWVYLGSIKIIPIEHDNETYNMPVFNPMRGLSGEDAYIKLNIFSKILQFIYYINCLPGNVEILYTGICSICGRKLTDPEYIAIGIGKICLENQQKI